MRWLLILTAYSVLGTQYSPAADKPVATHLAAEKMAVPEGFRVSLFAGEPDIVQPIAFTFDHRGRMWVVECLSYPKWRADGKGGDRVTILEDTDGDGKHDTRTVFLDNGVNLSGIELGFGGVWLCSTPNLVFVPDRDGDDKPDSPPEVLLDGWNLKDAKHNVFNGLIWGPDGWLYGCNGIQTKSRVGKPGTPDKDRVYLDCGVWRYHPTRKVFEVVAHGTTNPWGLDFDDYGEMFITNCVIDHLWHVVPGGHYQRMYGQDANPYTFGLMGPASDHKHWAGGHWTDSRADQKTGAVQKSHDDAGGGHAHSGCAVYLSDNFPAEYRNSVFMCNIHGNRVNRDTLHRTKAGYVGKHAKDFLFANDPWFRGICVKCGPDGGLYVSDWSDTGECHNYDAADTTNGRLYRVIYGNTKTWRGDLSKLSDAELVKLQLSKNEWMVRTSRRLLHERLAQGRLPKGAVAPLFDVLQNDRDDARRLRALWVLSLADAITLDQIDGLMTDPSEAVRSWGYQIATTFGPKLTPTSLFIKRAEEEGSALGLLHLASAAGRMPLDIRIPTVQRLTGHGLAADHRQISLAVWYAAADWYRQHPRDATSMLKHTTNTLVQQHSVRFVLAQHRPEFDHLLVLLLEALESSTPEVQVVALRVMHEELIVRKGVREPTNWPKSYVAFKASKSPDVRREADGVAVAFGDGAVIDALVARVADPHAPVADRREALQLVLPKRPDRLAPILRAALQDRELRADAVRGLSVYSDADSAAAILKQYPSFTAEEKGDAVLTLASRPAFAERLLGEIEAGTIPKADVSVFAARQIQALNNKAVSDRLAKVWGTVRPASATYKTQAEKFKNLLTVESLTKADVSNGRAVFVKHCASCHKLFGEGGDVGPELTGSQRANLDYVLENVLDPSSAVPGEYRMTTFNLADGRTLTGIIRKETPQAVTIRTVNEEIVVATADIDGRKQTALSVMPDGLFDAMKEHEVRDLVAYLASPKQVPLSTK